MKQILNEKFSDQWQQFRDFSRLKVFGGWIVYSSSQNDNGDNTAESMVYVPDPNHEWQVQTYQSFD